MKKTHHANQATAAGRNGAKFQQQKKRKGSVIVLAAAMMVMILAFAAFTTDIGYISLAKHQLQNAVDAAALAGALELNPRTDQDNVEAAAKGAAVEIAAMHWSGNHEPVIVEPETDVILGRRTWNPAAGEYTYETGPDAKPYNFVKVSAIRDQIEKMVDGQATEIDRRLPLFFAPVIGHEKSALEVSAIATFQPRDIMLVLDYSASMNDDSELKSMYALGLSAVEANIYEMWEDLGSPTYGNMGFTPDWVTVPGNSCSVKWRTDQVDVTSNGGNIQYCKLYFSSGYQTKSGSGTSKTFYGTGSKSGYRITKVKVKINGSWETFDFYDNSTIRKGLGLDNVPYPYASGSWDDYIEYCRSHSSYMPWYDSYVYHAGHRRKFGMLTLINFWNRNKPLNSQTGELWKASQQPITALKDSVDILLDYLIEAEAEDKVGLSVYTYPQGDGAKLEIPLTTDHDLIKTTSRQRQAGHYDYYTNIGAGLRNGRIELENNARPKAHRMIVLMTDGIANRSSTGSSPDQFALDEAALCAAAGIKVMTISLGLNADTQLMQQIADISGGNHFNVPGGESVAQYEEELKAVFGDIASDRPLQLINDDE